MISANGGLPAHRYTHQVTPRWPPGSEPASQVRPSHYLPVHQCLAVGSAVRCSAGGRGGGGWGPAVASAPYGRGPAAIHRHWEGGQGSHAAHASRHSSQSGAGLRALGPRGRQVVPGGAALGDPRNGGDLLCLQERCVPRPAPRAPGGGWG